jgi:cysteine-rich repeat protein
LLLTACSLAACFVPSSDSGLDDAGTTSGETSSTSETSSADTTQVEVGCPPGELDCPCDGGTCMPGLICQDGSCVASVCGNAVVEGTEQCDDGNVVDDDACSNACLLPICGDGLVQPGEQCDDGNAVDDDLCSNACVIAVCGDGIVQQGEFCDDGNDNAFDECSNTCTPASCGDGVVSGGEECDDGNADNADACTNGCMLPICGDWIVQQNEQCDDGNAVGGDGCSSSCTGECGNPGGGSLVAENGTGQNALYCYQPGDPADVRALKACESHFGIGACCVIGDGYNGMQYGQCDLGGNEGSIHWHWDNHPNGHCAPEYVVGDVVSPGWCGALLGNFLD